MFSSILLTLFLCFVTSVQSVDNIEVNIVSEHSEINEVLWPKKLKLNKRDFHSDKLLMDTTQKTTSLKENDLTLKQLKNVLSKFLKKNRIHKRHIMDRIGKLFYSN